MTFKQALEIGYYVYDIKKTYGYISRLTITDKQLVKTGKGSRRGELFVEIPNYTGTTFYYRYYIRK